MPNFLGKSFVLNSIDSTDQSIKMSPLHYDGKIFLEYFPQFDMGEDWKGIENCIRFFPRHYLIH